jgi:hypothetical protein
MPRALYLLRHEEAEPAASGPDGHRTLTANGRTRMHRTGRRFAQLGEPIDLILTSPLVRAVQTAEILATHLWPSRARSTLGYGSPSRPPSPIWTRSSPKWGPKTWWWWGTSRPCRATPVTSWATLFLGVIHPAPCTR